jgi:putative transcription factor
MLCEMCSTKDAAYKVEVEGSRLNVCEKCSGFGRVIARLASVEPKKDKKKTDVESTTRAVSQKKTETVQLIKADYAKLIKTAREKTGLTQEEFAKRISERESMIHNMESGHMKPNLELARKLERVLKISLVDDVEVEEPGQPEKKKPGEGLTLGDLIRIK